jgi:hypothetical protein
MPSSFGSRQCDDCGGLVIFANRRDVTRKRFCSASCRSRAAAKTQKKFMVNRPKDCAKCGTQFVATFARQKYCSKRCQGAAATMQSLVANNTLRSHLRRLLNRPERSGLSLDYLLSLYEANSGSCALSGVPMTWHVGSGRSETNISIDRIDSSLGYSRGNVQLVCRIVNIMKHDLPMRRFIEWCNVIAGMNSAISLRKAA